MSYRATIIRADGSEEERVTEHKLTLNELQEIVGGYIEFVTIRRKDGKRGQMIVNDEGHVKGLPINAKATSWYYPYPPGIAGDVVIPDYEID